MDNLPDDPLPVLRKALEDRSPAVVTTAARRIKQREVAGLEPEMQQAFERFLTEKDPGCRAKIAILEALLQPDAHLCLKALQHVQLEPCYGGKEDTAAELRALGAVGLAQSGWPDAAQHIVELLVDPEPPARVAGVRALAFLGGTEGALVLRLQALQGDADLVGECLEGLLRVEGARALGFVERFLNTPHFEAAALALGGSRLTGALTLLQSTWEKEVLRERKQALLVAFALARATDVLAELSREEWVRAFLEKRQLIGH